MFETGDFFMSKNKMDKSGAIIIKICIFSIIFSLTAMVLCGIFNYFDRKKTDVCSVPEYPVVIIDAGHGGEDGGAVASDGTKEKDLNLSVALSLGNMLEMSGINVVYTRTDDRMLYKVNEGSKKMQDLRERLNIANLYENSIFVSIHMNKFSQEKYSGLQVFYSQNDPKSQEIAKMIQIKTKENIQPYNDREIKPSGHNIYLLDKIEIPAVMVECGFLSNQEECEKLKNESYRMELAAVIYSSLIEFFENT